MFLVTAVSASKVCWGLYKGFLNSGPWFKAVQLQRVIIGSEEYFDKKYPFQTIMTGPKTEAIDWCEENFDDGTWNWIYMGVDRYRVGFTKIEDAVLFKTTWV